MRSFQPVRSISVREELKTLRENGIDAQIEIEFKKGYCRYGVEIKSQLKRPLPAYLYQSSRSEDEPLMIMSSYINPSIAADLKKTGIQYIDVAGNAFLQMGDCIHIEVKGKKPEHPVQTTSNSLFQAKLMQLVAILLIDSTAANQTIRVLSNRAGLSKDRASVGLRLLKEKGWLVPSGKTEYRLTAKRDLFDQWLMNYGERLRPKLVLGTYKMAPTMENKLEEKLAEIFVGQTNQYAMTGGIGADRLLHYYRGKSTEIFVLPDIADLVWKGLKLISSREPNITLLNLFSPDLIFYQGDTAVAHPLFIYAELLYCGGDRERETAQMIYDRYLREIVE
ncbi:type IV toxin-antitoxin system AbiEi family antitoxin [bacterium]|nr:type IV toxin-antitoxin system AbiEi family antitoxin [bacterium]